MKYIPQHNVLRKFIDHYWIIDDVTQAFQKVRMLYDYPGVKPEMLLILDGILNYQYQGKTGSTTKHLLSSHIHGGFLLDAQCLNRIVVIQFKPRSIASLVPFTNYSARELMNNSLCDAEAVFGKSINELVSHLKQLAKSELGPEIDTWLLKHIDIHAQGFVAELFSEIQDKYQSNRKSLGTIQMFKEVTNYSYSTIERHFKKETGLTPKKFESLNRYKTAVEEIYDSQSNDWLHYVDKYGYYDQSHFIKEIKKYTSFTPTQLLQTPGLRTYRPKEN